MRNCSGIEFHLFLNQLLRRNARQFCFSEILLALVKFTWLFLCISVACGISMWALRAMLLVYVDCCNSIYVGNIFFLNPHMLTCKIIKNAYYLPLRSLMSLWLEKYAHFIFSSFFFNVALQHSNPIDQNYVLFIGLCDFWISTPWDVFGCSCSFLTIYIIKYIVFFQCCIPCFSVFQNPTGFQYIFELTF